MKSKQKINLIVAMDDNMGIGKANSLPWHIPADMKFFRETTQNSVVIMGRKNWESIPEKFRPLPNRFNLVLTRNPEYQVPEKVETHPSIESALMSLPEDAKIFIIGGGEIYEEVLNKDIVDVMYITHVKGDYDADTFFPEFEMEKWTSEVIKEHQEEGNGFAIIKYERLPRLFDFLSHSGLTLENSTAEERPAIIFQKIHPIKL